MRTLILLLLCCGTLTAQSLKWKETEKTVKAAPSQQKLETEFEFTNASKQPVSILNIRVTCGCMASEFEKKTYNPGESGKIGVTFTIGNLKGLQEKKLVVQTSNNSPSLLSLTVEIEDLVKRNKDRLTWEVGDPLESQSFEITLPDTKSVKINKAEAIGGNFEAFLEEKEAGRTYEIRVKPLRTDAPARGSVSLQISDPTPRTIYLPLAVQG